MFRNYQELFSSAIQYYRISLFPAESFSIEHMNSYPNVSNYLKQQQVDGSTGCSELYGLPPIGHQASSVMSSFITEEYERLGNGFVEGIYDGLSREDLLYIVIIFTFLTAAKRYLSQSVQSSVWIRRLGLRPKDRERLDECLWRLIFYSLSSSWLIYSCFMKHHAQHYFDPDAIISEYSRTINQDEYLICLIEIGFYLHATYAIVFEDVWRKDTPMMMIHHIAAICAMFTIYTTRTHKIGLTVVVLRDTCDVLLEVGKLAMCLRIQHDKLVTSLDRSVKFFMVIFSTAFVVNQLYYYPLFCLYHAFNFIRIYRLYSPAITLVITCALVFLLLDLLWFLLIARLLYRMIFTNKPFEDLREYDNDPIEKESGIDTKACTQEDETD